MSFVVLLLLRATSSRGVSCGGVVVVTVSVRVDVMTRSAGGAAWSDATVSVGPSTRSWKDVSP